MCCMISMISEQSTSRIRQTEAASHNRFPGETRAGAGQQASGDHANTSWPHTHIVTRDLCSRYCVLKVGGVKNVQVDGSVLQSLKEENCFVIISIGNLNYSTLTKQLFLVELLRCSLNDLLD